MAKVTMNKSEQEMFNNNRQSGAYFDSMLRRFKKQVQKEEILYESMKREFFMNKALKRKEKSKRAKIRDLKRKK